MRRRFGRGRKGRGTGEGKPSPIDAARILAKIAEEGIVAAESLEPTGDGGDFAAVGTGTARDGTALVVAFSPRNGGDAALAAVAHARGLGDEFSGEVIAVAPQWTSAARRLLGALSDLPFRFRAVAASSLAEGEALVEAERIAAPPTRSARQAGAGLGEADQALFARAAAAFEGLAAKHGGSVRALGRGFELVLLARRVAVLQADDAGVVLETLLPDRSTATLGADDLSTAMDRFEGALRKRLNDRRVRGSEEGLRAEAGVACSEAADLRATLRWPLGGSDPEVLDLAGVRGDGRPVIAAVRTRLGLPALSAILDAAGRIQPTLPMLLADMVPPARPDPPLLLLAAREWESEVLAILPVLALECQAYDLQPRRGRAPELVLRDEASPLPRAASRPSRSRSSAPAAGSDSADAAASQGATGAEDAPTSARRRPARADGPRFEEISLFDVQDESSTPSTEEGAGRRRRRGRGRRRGRRGTGAASDDAPSDAPTAPDGDEETNDDTPEPREGRGRGRGRSRGRGERAPAAAEPPPEPVTPSEPEEDDVVDSEDELGLAPIDQDVPDQDEKVEPQYDDDEEEAVQTEEAPKVDDAEPAPEKPKPRRRAAIVAHADRDSIFAAVLLARDVRLVEGFWIYPQEDLMTFFRGVATDLREDTPIWLVGFNASPAIDSLQAAALYQGRLGWFDHQEWPPEDLERMRQTIGADNVVVHPGAGSSLPGILGARTRRSRFSDKLVELATGRFSQHDYERWGRLWWHRVGELAKQRGEHRRDVDALLSGRPSDLAREAADIAPPPLPMEVEYISGRDFRLVHFGGYTLCVVPAPPGLDLHLSARIARERYDAEISLAFTEGADLMVLAVDESRGRRGVEVGRLVDHLASKHSWIEALPNTDHVARMLVRDLSSGSERLDEVIREIAMSRSALDA